jgi:hypothetical protein
LFNYLSSREALTLASSVGLAEDEPSTIRRAILSFHATGSGALAIFNFFCLGNHPRLIRRSKLAFNETEKHHPHLQALV